MSGPSVCTVHTMSSVAACGKLNIHSHKGDLLHSKFFVFAFNFYQCFLFCSVDSPVFFVFLFLFIYFLFVCFFFFLLLHTVHSRYPDTFRFKIYYQCIFRCQCVFVCQSDAHSSCLFARKNDYDNEVFYQQCMMLLITALLLTINSCQ